MDLGKFYKEVISSYNCNVSNSGRFDKHFTLVCYYPSMISCSVHYMYAPMHGFQNAQVYFVGSKLV